MTWRASAVILLTLSCGCGERRSSSIAEPIPDIPGNHQRTVSRGEFGWQWPFSVGTGTLGCSSGAVVFRAGGTTYAVNDAAKSRGFAPIEAIRLVGSSGPPRNPLKRLTQDQRMRIFAESAACERKTSTESVQCKQALREGRAISEADLTQIEEEGRERRWPPLSPTPISINPLADAGLKLCQS
jgi:uncharacterized protein DUF2511